MGMRRNQNDISSDERDRFVAAVKTMKTTGVYDRYVQIHQTAAAMAATAHNYAHMGPVFFPWHRYFIYLFELDLQKADRANSHDGTITLPYWDWTHQQSRKAFLWWGRLWRDSFMGPDGRDGDGRVMDGPFATDVPAGNWPLPITQSTSFLQRTLGVGVDSLPSEDQLQNALKVRIYDSAPWHDDMGSAAPNLGFSYATSFRNDLEGWFDPDGKGAPQLHNRVHVWVGGSMSPMTSPNDPIFFLHHCNVDRIWALWQFGNPTADQYPLHRTGSPPPLPDPDPLRGHYAEDGMPPWDGGTIDPGGTNDFRDPTERARLPIVKPVDVINHRTLGYAYDTDPPQLNVKVNP